jgi:hypothetical protein
VIKKELPCRKSNYTNECWSNKYVPWVQVGSYRVLLPGKIILLAEEVIGIVNMWHTVMDTATAGGYALNEAF